MRFSSLEGLTGLPLERIRRQFRNEEVRSVLPALAEDGAVDSLLVATTAGLAIVSAGPDPSERAWMTRWAPWGAVRLSDGIGPFAASDDDEYHLGVLVDRVRFDVDLPGDAGRRAMRDFVVSAQERRSSVASESLAGPAVRA